MARSIEFRGHSSIIPIFDSSHRGSIPIIQIKEELIEDDSNSGICASETLYDSTNDLHIEQSTSQSCTEEYNKPVQLISKRLTRRSAAAATAAAEEIRENKRPVRGMNVNKNYNDNDDYDDDNDDDDDDDNNNNDDDDNHSSGNDNVRKFVNALSIKQREKKISESKIKPLTRSSLQAKACDICFSIFPDQNTLKLHLVYYNPDLLKCRMCSLHFKNVYEFMDHRLSIHSQSNILVSSKFQCDYCKIVIRCKKHLQQHLFHYHYDEIYSKQPDKTPEISNEIRSPTTRLSNSSLSIGERKAEKRKRSKSLSHIVNKPIAPLHSINTRFSSGRRALRRIPADSPKNTTSLLNKDQPSDNNSPEKLIPHTNTSINFSQPPLVQIYAIPNEVEALLSDCENVPAKRKKLHASSYNNIDNDTKIDFDSSKSSTLSTSNSPIKLNNFSCTPESLRISTLKENFNCRDCVVRLEKLNSSEDNILKLMANFKETSLVGRLTQICTVESNTKNSTSIICGTVGIELENLDIALKKLENPQDTSLNTDPLPILDSISEETNVEHSYSSTNIEESDKEVINESLTPVKIRKVYLSSVCRTRFTTQKKLIYHYLNYHGYPNYICIVCRTKCSRLGELKKHLVVHCIGILKSPDDQSPIDPKGPCENSKKKFTCKTCKKGFSTNFSLGEHTRQCPIIRTKVETPHEPSNTEPVFIDMNFNENMVVNQSENDISLLSSTSENQLTDLEINLIENNYPLTSSSLATLSLLPSTLPPCPSPPSSLIPRPVLPLLMPSAIEAISDHTNVIEKNHQAMYDWSEYVHSEIPRQKISINPNYKYKCDVCQTQFCSRENLTIHIKKFQSDKTYLCTNCKTCFPSSGLLAAHRKATHNKDLTIYKVFCLVCDQGFSERKYLRHHIMHIHNYELQIYKKLPDIDTEFKVNCRICDVMFKSRKTFIEHVMYYYNDRSVKCECCGKEFHGQYMCHAHSKQVHLTDNFYISYPYSCEICADRFKYENHWQSHVFHFHSHRIPTKILKNQRQRHPEQYYKCATCAENFETQLLLTQHEMEFTNSGIYNCNQCNRRCTTLTILKNHKKTSHYGYAAPHFQKCHRCCEFVSPKFYISHLKHFHNEDNHHQQLEFYEKSLDESMEYSQHTNIFNTYDNQRNSDNLESWISSEVYSDNAIEYTCAICDMKFKSNDELKEHMKSHRHESNSDNHNMYNFTNQHFESEPQMGAYENDDDSKFNIANVCSVQLEEHDNLGNSDIIKELNTISDKSNSLVTSRYNQHDLNNHDRNDHHHQQHKEPEIICNEALTIRNVKQTMPPHFHQEFSAMNLPEFIVNNDETEVVPQIISITREQPSLVNDPKSPRKKPSGTCQKQTKINQYFQKSQTDNITLVLCDTCGVGFEKNTDLIQHKNESHSDLIILSSTKNQNSHSFNYNANISSSSSLNNLIINRKSSSPEQLTITINDNDEADVENCTDIIYNDNLQNHNSVCNDVNDDDDLQIIENVDQGILFNCLQKT